MSIIEAIVLGLVQGLTEFIPVSSSGHLLLVHELFGGDEASLGFDVALHAGTLAALLVYFRSELVQIARAAHTKTKDGRLARLLIVATIPAALAGLLLDGFIEDNLRSSFVVACSLAGVGLLMLVADKYATLIEHHEIRFGQGVFIGISQVLALIPGVSRSGITITAGLFAGLSRQQAARFSFLLAIPIIAGSAVGVLLKGDVSTDGNVPLLLGMFVAFASGLMAIRFLLGIIGKVGLMPFAIYRIILAVIVLFTLV